MAVGRVFDCLAYTKAWDAVQHGAWAIPDCDCEGREKRWTDGQQTKDWDLVVCAGEISVSRKLSMSPTC